MASAQLVNAVASVEQQLLPKKKASLGKLHFWIVHAATEPLPFVFAFDLTAGMHPYVLAHPCI